MRWLARSSAVLLTAALAAGGARAQSVSGTGQQASELFPLSAGLAVFELEHQGSGTFSVRLLNREGAVVEVLAEAQGPFRGSKAVRVPRAGEYLFDVRADGAWSIRPREGAAAASSPGVAADSSLLSVARYEGEQAARKKGAFGWMGAGLLGGATLGPVGAGLVIAAAVSRDSRVPTRMEGELEAHPAPYRDTFSEAYRRRLRAERRVAALVGGVTGTAIFGFVVAQIAHWDDGEGGGPRGGGEVP
jgi:hypothetical protein